MAELARYRAKRDFTKTKEPKGRKSASKASRFVVQKHDATNLHYDFRLELDGVLKSWAVAKGPSLVAGEKRLAIHVEDHPLDYADFEGTIPQGEYGGGTVMVWDSGEWEPEGDAQKDYAKGRLSFRLQGQKLNGEWHLVRMRPRPKERQESWLLIKAEDAFARLPDEPDILQEAPRSARTGRTLEEIAQGAKRGAKKAHAASNQSSAAKKGKAASEEVRKEKSVRDIPKENKASPMKPPDSGGGTKAAGRRVAVAGVALTHPDRVLWDEQGITKQDLAEYYVAIADWILPHIVGRPLSLVRCPSGSEKGCFFQKHSWAGITDLIVKENVRDETGEEEVLLVRDIKGVVALVQAGVLEIHPWGSLIDDIEKPDRLIFDFDPGEGVQWSKVIDGARELRQRLKEQKLESFAKTTGGKGLHVVAPLTPRSGWDEVKAFAKAIVDEMAANSPDLYLTKAAKRERGGKIFLDYLRNGRGATAVAAYSTRARAGAPVSTPLSWDELSTVIKSDHFTVATLPARLNSLGEDPWRGFFKVKQLLPAATAGKRRK